MSERPYGERDRPQFHFTARENWLNDPNGLLFYDGEYHLFFQHNPSGIEWGNMTWGHAVSPDLVRWTQLDHALHPDEHGTMFSGSGVVDWKNTSGFGNGSEPPLVVLYTAAGKPFTQCAASSRDRGRTWTKYAGNPVLDHLAGDNRDPKVIWHEPTARWVMTLYLEKHDFAVFTSPDLKSWTKTQDLELPDTSECPDLFPIPVNGDPDNVKWVFWGANGNHYFGSFDGETFRPESDLRKADHGANFYAAQTWSDIPSSDGRCIQIAWMQGGKYPGMPFNQQMSIPCELTLRATDEGIRLFRAPVRELESLRERSRTWTNVPLRDGANPLAEVAHDLLDIDAEIEIGDAQSVELVLRGEPVRWDAETRTVSFLGRSGPLNPEKGHIRLRILLDRTSIELFGNGGRLSMTSCFLPEPENRTFSLTASGGGAVAASLVVHELRSAWT